VAISIGNRSSLLSSATLLYDPAAWILSIEEDVSLRREYIIRSRLIHLVLPDRPLAGPADVIQQLPSEFRDETDAAIPPPFYVPLLVDPRKGQLADISNLAVRDGRPIALASHTDHLKVCSAILELGAVQVLRSLLEPGTPTELEEFILKMSTIPHLPPEDAAIKLEELFDPEFHARIQPEKPRPSKEVRLFLLCQRLVERYILFARVFAQPGDELLISYDLTTTRRDKQQRISRNTQGWLSKKYANARSALGAVPSDFNLPLLAARRTNNFVLRMPAPTGLYFGTVEPAVGAGRGQCAAGLYREARTAPVPVMTTHSAGTSRAVVHVHNGPKSKLPLSLHLMLFELPPGAQMVAFGVAALSWVSVTTVVTLTSIFRSSGFDTPALISALIALATFLVRPLLPQTAVTDSPLAARTIVVACGLLSFFSALWVAFEHSGIRHGWMATHRWLLAPFRYGGGVACVTLLFLLVWFAAVRARKALRAYHHALDRST
jgi:hypothetical protein